MFKFDFSLESSEDRANAVSAFFQSNPNYKPTQKETDAIANYILYGKDSDGLSVVDRGEVIIDTKYNSYKKRQAESLDALMETPGFNEGTAVQYGAMQYKQPKPQIDREADADIPGIAALWQQIDSVEHRLALAQGKVEPQPGETVPNYTSTQLYHLKHNLIELRRQQYYLKEAHKPIEHNFSPCAHRQSSVEVTEAHVEANLWNEFLFLPLGLFGEGDTKRFTEPQKFSQTTTKWDGNQWLTELPANHYVDFREVDHVYMMSKFWRELEGGAISDSTSVGAQLMRTLRFYVELAELSEVQREIWRLRCAQWSNKAICERLREKFGVGYGENYISTIFRNNICTDIAAAAQLHADYFWNRGDNTMWKVCSHCGQRKLRDSREFMRKSKSSDGLAGRCKKCEAEVRRQKKEGAQ